MRATLQKDLLPLRETLPQLIPILEAQPDWYGSVFFERKSAETFMANLKQTNVTDQMSIGAVLRIYNGYTLFEQATDELDIDSLKNTAAAFAKRVAATPAGTVKRS